MPENCWGRCLAAVTKRPASTVVSRDKHYSDVLSNCGRQPSGVAATAVARSVVAVRVSTITTQDATGSKALKKAILQAIKFTGYV